jgi:integrase/recombinase XerD
MRETHMKRALTLNEQQYRYAITFCNTRKHTLRDQTIIHISFLAGLRAIEIAALCVGDVYDERGRARSQFTITQAQTKGDSARTIYVNKKLMRCIGCVSRTCSWKSSVSATVYDADAHTL